MRQRLIVRQETPDSWCVSGEGCNFYVSCSDKESALYVAHQTRNQWYPRARVITQHIDTTKGTNMKTIETYSRGLELLRDIWRAWALNEAARGVNRNKEINARMADVKEKHELTWDEYYYWTKVASEKASKVHFVL